MRTRLYEAWHCMHQRCNFPRHPYYKNYGGRGILVCAQWWDYDLFVVDMGPHPGSGWTLDRYPDKNGNYEKSNCRWATRTQQNRHRRLSQNTGKLTGAIVADIRARYVRPSYRVSNTRELAAQYGLERGTVQRLVKGALWTP